MESIKNSILNNYLEYSKIKHAYKNQNFWLIITAFLLLISVSMVTTTPWIIFHYATFTMALGSAFMCIVNAIKNRGIITPRRYNHARYTYYVALDNIIDSLIDDEEIGFMIKSRTKNG